MAKALSIDLRVRVLKAIADGLSRRQAAARFGVSAASAIAGKVWRNGWETPDPSRKGATGGLTELRRTRR